MQNSHLRVMTINVLIYSRAGLVYYLVISSARTQSCCKRTKEQGNYSNDKGGNHI